MAFDNRTRHFAEFDGILRHFKNPRHGAISSGFVGGNRKTHGGFNVQRHDSGGNRRFDDDFDGVRRQVDFRKPIKERKDEHAPAADSRKALVMAFCSRNDSQFVAADDLHFRNHLKHDGQADQDE